jgi:segregation and condensation protein B
MAETIEKDLENFQKIVSLLFVNGDPLSFKKIAEIINLTDQEVETIVQANASQVEKLGLSLVINNAKVQLISSAKNQKYILKLVGKDKKEKLNKALLEVLSIICYKENTTKHEIDTLRGVDSKNIIKKLFIKGLIEKKLIDKKVCLIPSFKFLRFMGIKNIKELPNFEEIKNNKEIKSFFKN